MDQQFPKPQPQPSSNPSTPNSQPSNLFQVQNLSSTPNPNPNTDPNTNISFKGMQEQPNASTGHGMSVGMGDSDKGKQNLEEGNQMGEDMDDQLDDLDLFHKSSLRNKQELPLPQLVQETYNIKKYTDEQGQQRIKDYIQICKIGQGAFAQVKKAKHQSWSASNPTLYAIKIYHLPTLKKRKFYAADGNFADSQQMLQNQVQIIKRISHVNLTRCYQILYGGGYAYFVMELCDLGQVMDWDQSKNNYVRNQKVFDYLKDKYQLNGVQDVTRIIFLQVSLGLQYLHYNNISNRDIKVDNILCKTTAPQVKGQDIKIADFTTVRYSKDDISYFTCGTAGFRGPQIQNAGSDGYSCKAMDIWSLGISMYTYYYQFFPFMAESDYFVQLKVEQQELKYDENCPKWLKQVLMGMTKKNWKERIQIDRVIQILMNQGQVNCQ